MGLLTWCLISAPVVTETKSINGPVSGGVSVTLSGVNFGQSDPSPTAHVMMTVCRTTAWSSTTGLVCGGDSGSGVGTLLSVRVTVGELVGTDTGVFTYDGGPVFCALSPCCVEHLSVQRLF